METPSTVWRWPSTKAESSVPSELAPSEWTAKLLAEPPCLLDNVLAHLQLREEAHLVADAAAGVPAGRPPEEALLVLDDAAAGCDLNLSLAAASNGRRVWEAGKGG